MPYSQYTILSGLSQGETGFALEKEQITDSYIDFVLKAYSEKWQNIDAVFEYRFNDNDQWRTDASIIGAESSYVQQNKLLGITSDNQGGSNKFRWKYINNSILEGMEIQIRIRILPRVRTFSNYQDKTTISEIYGDNFSDNVGFANGKCIGNDLFGRYIYLTDDGVEIYESLNDNIPIYTLNGIGNVSFVKQIENRKYIVANYSNNKILELDETLSTISKIYAISKPVHFDFSEFNKTLLVVSEFGSSVKEITWEDEDYGNLIWESESILINASCVNYNRNNFDDIVVVDYGNSKVITINKKTTEINRISHYRIKDGYGVESSKRFWHPYRAYFYEDNTICVTEKDGEIVVGGFYCPNNINSISNTSIKSDLAFSFDKYLNININDGTDKNNYLLLFDGDMTGQTYDESKTFWGDTPTSGTMVSNGYVSIVINQTQYYLPKYTDVIGGECCSNVYGEDMSDGTFEIYGYALIYVNATEAKYTPIYVKIN